MTPRTRWGDSATSLLRSCRRDRSNGPLGRVLLKHIIRFDSMAVNTAMNLSDQQFLRKLGTRIREQRLARGWSQLELGRRTGLHRTFIGSVERGERNVSILNLRVIARALRVSVADIVRAAD